MLSLLIPLIFPLLPVTNLPVPALTAPTPVQMDLNSFAGAIPDPEIWFAFPTEGAALTPVLLLGMNFADAGYAPRFGLIPSVPLFQFGIDIPFLGQPSLMLTTAPPTIFGGEVDMYLKRGVLGKESNRLTFTYL